MVFGIIAAIGYFSADPANAPGPGDGTLSATGMGNAVSLVTPDLEPLLDGEIDLNDLGVAAEVFGPAGKVVSRMVRGGKKSGNSSSAGAKNRTLTSADFPEVNARLSTQRQNRHLEGGLDPRTGLPATGSVMRNQSDAQQVLDAYRSNNATIVGQTRNGDPIVRVDGVTGRYRNELNTGRVIDEPSNVFIIKGTRSPSIVPANPQSYQ